MNGHEKWLRIIFILLISLTGLWALGSLDGSPVLACCHGGGGGGGGGGGDHPPEILQIEAPKAVDANSTAKGSLVWKDDDGDATWVEFQMCQNVNVGCAAVGGWNPNPYGLTAGAVPFDITCNGLTGSWVGMAQVSDKANHSSGWSTYRFECVEEETPPSCPVLQAVNGQEACPSDGGFLYGISGTVNVNGSPASNGMTFGPGDLIEVGPYGSAKFRVPSDNADYQLSGLEKGASLKWPSPPPGLLIRTFQLIKGLLGLNGPTKTKVECLNTTIGTEGTIFSVDSDPDIQQDTISVEEGSVQVTPRNPALPPFVLSAGNQVQVAPNSVSPITPIGSGPTPTPPPSGGGSSLKSFDKNHNDVIEDAEFFAIIDAWIASQIDDPTFFKAVDLWISGQPIAAAGASLTTPQRNTITLASNRVGNALTFTAYGQAVVSMGVEVFNLNGQRVFTQETTRPRLTWNLQTSNGQPVANGVYLYVVGVRGLDGVMWRSKIKKLIVRR